MPGHLSGARSFLCAARRAGDGGVGLPLAGGYYSPSDAMLVIHVLMMRVLGSSAAGLLLLLF